MSDQNPDEVKAKEIGQASISLARADLNYSEFMLVVTQVLTSLRAEGEAERDGLRASLARALGALKHIKEVPDITDMDSDPCGQVNKMCEIADSALSDPTGAKALEEWVAMLIKIKNMKGMIDSDLEEFKRLRLELSDLKKSEGRMRELLSWVFYYRLPSQQKLSDLIQEQYQEKSIELIVYCFKHWGQGETLYSEAICPECNPQTQEVNCLHDKGNRWEREIDDPINVKKPYSLPKILRSQACPFCKPMTQEDEVKV